jgi:hypothetical protein
VEPIKEAADVTEAPIRVGGIQAAEAQVIRVVATRPTGQWLIGLHVIGPTEQQLTVPRLIGLLATGLLLIVLRLTGLLATRLLLIVLRLTRRHVTKQ